MTSAIDATKPVAVTPTTASVRANFASAKAEIEALQAAVLALQGGTQPLDATLTALAAVNTTVDKLIYATGADQFATTALTAQARTLLACASAAAARAALGATGVGDGLFTAVDAAAGRLALSLGSLATQNATAVQIAGGVINGAVVSRAGLSLGGWHPSRFHGGQATLPHSTQTVGLSANTLYAVPFAVGDTATFVRIGIDVTAADAGKAARLGVYAWSDGQPGARILDAGTVSVATTGVKEIVISQALGAGLYALAVVSDGAPSLRGGDATPVAVGAIGTAVPGAADYRISRGYSYGALPDPWGTPGYAGGSLVLPGVYLRTGV